MIHELRIYRCLPGRLPALLKRLWVLRMMAAMTSSCSTSSMQRDCRRVHVRIRPSTPLQAASRELGF